jgi:predicted small lipoprotein YifL
MPRRRIALLAVAVALAGALAACGGDPRMALTTPPAKVAARPIHVPERPAVTVPGPNPSARDAQRLRPALAGWGRALRRGDDAAAARYFALPVVITQGETTSEPTGALRLTTRSQVRAFNGGLPCGARLRSLSPSGPYVIARYVLTPRPRHDCGSGVGQELRVAVIARGRRFLEWRLLPQAGRPRRLPRVA